MSYAINGTVLLLQPTEGQWLPREIIGYDGRGRAIYEPTRSFELRWELISFPQFEQLQDFFNSIGSTGSVVISLPNYSAPAYAFYAYTGAYVDEPRIEGGMFEQHQVNVSMRAWNIVDNT